MIYTYIQIFALLPNDFNIFSIVNVKPIPIFRAAMAANKIRSMSKTLKSVIFIAAILNLLGIGQ